MTETSPARSKAGKFISTVEGAQRDANAARLRARGMSLREIAAKLGYHDEAGASRGIQRALDAVPVAAVAELRKLEVEKLDALERTTWSVMLKRHYVVAASGKVATDPETGEPLTDDGPVLAATDRLLKIAERRARLLGLDSPTKVDVRATNDLDAEIESLLAQLAERRAIEPGDVTGRSPDEA